MTTCFNLLSFLLYLKIYKPNKMNWKAKIISHQQVQRIAVIFEKDARLIARIKTFEDARWSASKGLWHLPDTIENRTRFKILSAPIPSPEGIQQLEKYKQWLQSKRYSDNTIKTYGDALQLFLTFSTINQFLRLPMMM